MKTVDEQAWEIFKQSFKFVFLPVFLALFFVIIGMIYEKQKRRPPIRISQAAIWEMGIACAGQYQDLVANEEYVYANCVQPRKPVTIQNYIFR